MFKKYRKFKYLVFQVWLLKKRPRSLLFYTSRGKKKKNIREKCIIIFQQREYFLLGNFC